jgi:hypothetical protein
MTDTYTCQLRRTPLKASLQRSQGDLSQRLARIQTDLHNPSAVSLSARKRNAALIW